MKMRKWRVSLYLIISFLWRLGLKGKMLGLAAKLTGWKIDIKSETQAEQEYGRVKTYSEEMHQDSLVSIKFLFGSKG